LPQEQVLANQRERLLTAITDLSHERGYRAITVADVLARASVSRASFYELFSDREHCLLCAYDAHVIRAQAQIISAYRNPKLEGSERLRAAFDSLFELIISWPAAARLCMSEIATVGVSGLQRRAHIADVSATALQGALGEIYPMPVSANFTQALIGGISHLAYNRVRDGREGELAGASDGLIDWIESYPAPPPEESPHGVSLRLEDADLLEPRRPSPGADGAQQERDLHAEIIAAITPVISSKGYQRLTYRDIAASAQISLTTFYKYFANKRNVFLAVFDRASQHYAEIVRRAFCAKSDRSRAVREAIRALVGIALSDPRTSRLAASEILLTGRPGVERIDAIFEQAQSGLTSSFEVCPHREGFLYELIVGAVGELLLRSVLDNQPPGLEQLEPQLAYLALAPLIGSAQALEVISE
jgi:AcrR family transcriptional regulator